MRVRILLPLPINLKVSNDLEVFFLPVGRMIRTLTRSHPGGSARRAGAGDTKYGSQNGAAVRILLPLPINLKV